MNQTSCSLQKLTAVDCALCMMTERNVWKYKHARYHPGIENSSTWFNTVHHTAGIKTLLSQADLTVSYLLYTVYVSRVILQLLLQLVVTVFYHGREVQGAMPPNLSIATDSMTYHHNKSMYNIKYLTKYKSCLCKPELLATANLQLENHLLIKSIT